MADDVSKTKLESSLPPDVIARCDLRPDETVLWVGKPEASAGVSKKMFLFIAAGYSVFAIPLMLNVAQLIAKGESWTLLLVVLAPYLGLFFWACAQYFIASETVYLVTNKRALIVKPNRNYEVRQAVFLDRIARKDGLTDLVLDRISGTGRSATSTTLVGFLCLKDPDVAEDLLIKILEPPLVRKYNVGDSIPP